MSLQSNKIYWLAGLLEGEGNFGLAQEKYPRIQLKMTDLDTIQKARDIMNSSNNIHNTRMKSGELAYIVVITGQKAAEWMMTIYILMSARRREKIREVLQVWKSIEVMTKGERVSKTKRENKILKLIMMSRNVSREEAEKILGDSLSPVKQTIN